jgi:predicted ester cyclase
MIDDSAARDHSSPVLAFYDAANTGDLAVLEDAFAPTIVLNTPRAQVVSVQEVKRDIRTWRRGFPDLHATVDDLIVNGDRVVVRSTWRGTHAGEFWGVAPGGRRMTAPHIAIWRVVDGCIEEAWIMVDMLGVLRQLDSAQHTDQAVG